MRSFIRYREVIRNLVSKDLKLKYRDSVLGFLWSLAIPLILILAYSFVFSHILRGAPQNFAYFLMIGILPWDFFAESFSMAPTSIVRNGGLIRKIGLPLEVFPVATVLFNFAQFLLALAVFFPLAIFLRFRLPGHGSCSRSFWLCKYFLCWVRSMVSTATVFYRECAILPRPSAKHARFGFALPIKLDPDVLLVDEVMAVDDEPFQKKCTQQIGTFRSDGKTNIFVLHSPEAVKEVCVRA